MQGHDAGLWGPMGARPEHSLPHTCAPPRIFQSGVRSFDLLTSFPEKYKCSGLVHWEDPEGSDGEGSGRGDWDGNTCKSMADSCQMYGKTHYNIVK